MSDSWCAHTQYSIGNKVCYGNQIYLCLQNHTSSEYYTPIDFNGTLWTDLPSALASNLLIQLWFVGKYFYAGTVVLFETRLYQCLRNHIATPWDSPAHSAICWQQY
jgi:hypothetical protein